MYIIAYIKDIALLPEKLPQPNYVKYYPKGKTYRVAWQILDYVNNDKEKTVAYLEDLKFMLQLSSNGNIIGWLAKFKTIEFENKTNDIYRLADFDIFTKTQKYRLRRAFQKAQTEHKHLQETKDFKNAVFKMAKPFVVELARLRWECLESMLIIAKWANIATYGRNGLRKEYCNRLATEMLSFAKIVREQIKAKYRERKVRPLA
jgi:hypothetical protein